MEVLSFPCRIDASLGNIRLEIAGNRREQLLPRRELALEPGDEVLDPPGKLVGLRVAAHFQHIRAPTRILGFRVEGHRRLRKETDAQSIRMHRPGRKRKVEVRSELACRPWYERAEPVIRGSGRVRG